MGLGEILMKQREVLLSTLGFSPQIITITLDALSQAGHRIEEVVTIYTDHPRVRHSLAQLDAELTRMGSLSHRPVLITAGSGPIHDFLTEADAEAFLRTLYCEVKNYKDKG
jgi:hypothetical protein